MSESNGVVVQVDSDVHVVPVELLADRLLEMASLGANARKLLLAAVIDGKIATTDADEIADAIGISKVAPEIEWLDSCTWCGEQSDTDHTCSALLVTL